MSYVLTLVASNTDNPIDDEDIGHVIRIIRMQGISPTCQPIALAKDGKAMDLGVDEPTNRETLKNLHDYLKTKKIDVFINAIENRRKKMLIADMDSTILKAETLDELAVHVGLHEKISEITNRAMNGELDFHEAIIERVGLLKDLPISAVNDTLQKLETNRGAHTFVKTLRENGVFCVLVSGGFTVFTGPVAKSLGFNEHKGNTLGIKNEKLTGKVISPILDSSSKLQFLLQFADLKDIGPEQALTIGDGANDLPMLERAGMGIGFHPKPKVSESIDNLIIHGDLTAALYAQGYIEQDFYVVNETNL